MKYRFRLFDSPYDVDEDLLFLHSLYADFDAKVEAFSREADIRCSFGCGRCCDEHEPGITHLEGLYAAHWIAAVKPHLAARFDRLDSRGGCIFFSPGKPLHCMIYPARPLLCRAFGYSGVTDKQGKRVYRSCRYMPEIKKLEGNYIPLMTLAGTELTCRQDARNNGPVSVVVAQAWQKLQLRLRYTNSTTEISGTPIALPGDGSPELLP